MNKRTIITDNTEPPKDYLWHKLSPAGLDLGVYEYRDGKWNKVEIGGSSEVEDDNWYYSLKDLEKFAIWKFEMNNYGDPNNIGEIDVTDQIISENKDEHYIIIPKNIYDLGKENDAYSKDFNFECVFNGKQFFSIIDNKELIRKYVYSTSNTGQEITTIYYSPIYTTWIFKPFLFMVDNA